METSKIRDSIVIGDKDTKTDEDSKKIVDRVEADYEGPSCVH